MTVEEWRADVAARRPELTHAQLSALRPLGQRMAAHLAATETAPAGAGAVITAPQLQEQESPDVHLAARS